MSDMRKEFEAWASDDGKYPKAVERGAGGAYILMMTHIYWMAWQAAAILASQQREELKRQVAVMRGLLKEATEPDATQEKANIGMCSQWDVDALKAITATQSTAEAYDRKVMAKAYWEGRYDELKGVDAPKKYEMEGGVNDA